MASDGGDIDPCSSGNSGLNSQRKKKPNDDSKGMAVGLGVFGSANMAMLLGVVMLAHQIGGFLGAYLGGQVMQATGSYNWMWYADAVLAVGAALIHLPIKEQSPPAIAAEPA